MTQLWKSQMNQGMSEAAWAMNRSIQVDITLWPYEIQGSKAHATMLGQAGLISQAQARQLNFVLDELAQGFELNQIQVLPSDEDIHGLIERLLTEQLGSWASMIHMGRSRNEQAVLAEKLLLLEQANIMKAKLSASIDKLETMAEVAGETIIPSYTHLRRAQPMFLRQYWLAHAHLWQRAVKDLDHFIEFAMQESPMGAGAINGTTLETDPIYEAKLLGFKGPPVNALAMVSSRSDSLRFASLWVHWMLDVSRLMEDLILWSSDEFKTITMHSDVTSGSSMMPQKRNPDICELMRGKSAVVLGLYTGLMTLTKGLPMGYMKDLQEDKTLLLPLIREISFVLNAMPELLNSIQVETDATTQASADPMLLATDIMEILITQGKPMREAHHEVADCIAEAVERQVDFESLARQRWQLPEDAFDVLSSCSKRAP